MSQRFYGILRAGWQVVLCETGDDALGNGFFCPAQLLRAARDDGKTDGHSMTVSNRIAAAFFNSMAYGVPQIQELARSTTPA